MVIELGSNIETKALFYLLVFTYLSIHSFNNLFIYSFCLYYLFISLFIYSHIFLFYRVNQKMFGFTHLVGKISEST